ncbi:MAG: phosphoribosyltransferase [Bacteroidales bacterium]|jgi:hypoxanthine phosphoribosyltransferase|nr:phosphoribosyltransferase family protein [Bacteroidales bacterium]HPB02318.1 phosphoribosyltransferase family protein [Bacteroidales bacterium]HPF01025.1 phosphoribosyltransferase family protein [Bacteroidales bacterium]
MNSVTVHNRQFNLYLKHNDIVDAIEKLAARMNEDLKDKNPLFIVVLNGAFVFASELITRFQGDCDVTFVRLASYEGTESSNSVRELMSLNVDVEDRTIVIVEDIIDSGLTMLMAKDKLKAAGARDVLIATLLYKPKAFKHNYYIHYVGIEIPNDFIIGFGLDYDGKGRNLRDIYKIAE